MLRRIGFWLTLVLSLALPTVAMAATKAAAKGPGMTVLDGILLFVATACAFLWLLSVII